MKMPTIRHTFYTHGRMHLSSRTRIWEYMYPAVCSRQKEANIRGERRKWTLPKWPLKGDKTFEANAPEVTIGGRWTKNLSYFRILHVLINYSLVMFNFIYSFIISLLNRFLNCNLYIYMNCHHALLQFGVLT